MFVQTQPFSVLQLTRSHNVDKYTEESVTVKCRGQPGSHFESQSPELRFSALLSPPQTVNWTLATCKPVAQSINYSSSSTGSKQVGVFMHATSKPLPLA